MMLRRILTTGLAMVWAVAGCDCDSASRLVITDPLDGATLTTDADPATSGFQYDVVVRVGVLTEGDTVRIYRDATVLETNPNAATPFTAVVGSSREVTVRTTLLPGLNPIIACAQDACAMRSHIATVTVEDSATCPAVSFSSPALGTDAAIHLGPTDDQDGTACGAEFAATVRANVSVPDGTAVRLVVNGVSAAMVNVTGGAADFGNVVLGNRGDTANSLSLAIDGTTCTTPIGKAVFVDCDGSSCAITAPSPTTMFLNASNDADTSTPGLQLDVTVTSDVDTAGELSRLILDDNDATALTQTAVAAGPVTNAVFTGVTIAEGAHTVQGECKDVVGNVTRSSVAMWTVDTTACGVAISSPTTGQDIGTTDDTDNGMAGIQINTSGTATGTDCTDVRVSACSAISGATFGTLTANAFTSTVTLGSAPSQNICAEIRDAAGNIAQAMVQVDVTSDAPALTIQTPVAGASFNHLGGPFGPTTYIADLTPGTNECDVAFTVACEGVGVNVELVSGTTVIGSAMCVTNGTSPFGGLATFTSIALPTTDTSFTIFARQTVGGSPGMSAPVAISADCDGPSLSVTSPVCGSTVTVSSDLNTMLPGIQTMITIASPNTPQVNVSWVIVDTNMSLSDMGVSTTTVGTDHIFPAEFTSTGTFNINGSAIDPFGNQGQTPTCSVAVVNDSPTLSVTKPDPDTVINLANLAANDCAPGTMGLQILVSATTNATDGSAATIQIGSATPFGTTASGGVISMCVDALEDGVHPVTITVNDTTTGDGVSGTATAFRNVTIDLSAPVATFSPTVMITNHRIATANLTFAAVADDLGAFTSYLMRCSPTAIDNETKWNAATVVTITDTPATSGMQTVSVGSLTNRVFRTGVRSLCVLRATDLGGNISPLPASSFAVLPVFEQTTIDSGASTGMRMGRNGARAIGDVDGDGIPDLLVNGSGAAYLYFGTTSLGATDSPDIIFTKAVGSKLGTFVAGLGRFSSDLRNDFAIGDYTENGSRGAVYVFFGRSREDWLALAPTGVVSIAETGCDANLCIRGTDLAASARLGRDVVGLGDFDGDGDDDLGIGMNGLNQVLVISGRDDSETPITISSNPDGFLITGPPTVPTTTDFGWGVLATGDILGTTETDMIVLASGKDPAGSSLINPPKLYRVSGRMRLTPGLTAIGIGADIVQIATDRTFSPGSFEFNERTGLAVIDFDNDGDKDLAGYDSLGDDSLRIFLNDGSAGFTNAQSVQIVAATMPFGDFIGATIASAYHPRFSVGDIDRDGIQDVLASAVGAGASNASSVGLIYGRAAPTPLIDWTTNDRAAVLSPTPLPDLPIGIAIRLTSYVGDVDGDGFEDLVVTDPTSDGAMFNGRAFLLH